MWVILIPAYLQIYLVLSLLVVAYEGSDHFVKAAVITGVVVLVGVYLLIHPGLGWSRLAQQWAAGYEVDRARALYATYTYARRAVVRSVAGNAALSAALLVGVGVIAGASGSRLVQYGVLGAVTGTSLQLVGVQSLAEGALRPVRIALVGDTGIGESVPRPRPTFAA